jgi:YbbR domain-containing protein
MIQFLRQLVLQDFWLKLFSLALATLIWLTVSIYIHKNKEGGLPSLGGNPLEERLTLLNIPIKVVAEAADVRNFKVTPTTVDVTVRGQPEALKNLERTQIRALVDLTDVAAARLASMRIDITVPPGITIESWEPRVVEVIVPPRR